MCVSCCDSTNGFGQTSQMSVYSSTAVTQLATIIKNTAYLVATNAAAFYILFWSK